MKDINIFVLLNFLKMLLTDFIVYLIIFLIVFCPTIINALELVGICMVSENVRNVLLKLHSSFNIIVFYLVLFPRNGIYVDFNLGILIAIYFGILLTFMMLVLNMISIIKMLTEKKVHFLSEFFTEEKVIIVGKKEE